MENFSKLWGKSKNQGKQRKYKSGAPLHTKKKFMRAHLSKDLRKKYGKRSTGIRKGDRVKIIRGEFKKHEGKVEKIELRNAKVFVSGVETTKKDGTKKLLPLEPSCLALTELNLDDKLRQKILERK